MNFQRYLYALLMIAALLASAWEIAAPNIAEAANAIVYRYEYKEGKFDIEYPHIDGLDNQDAQQAINNTIQGVVDSFISTNNENEFTTVAKMQYLIHLNEDNRFSMSITQYTYSGGAHGMSSLEGYTFDLVTGQRYQFSDLFKLDQENRQMINRNIEQQIRERNIYVFSPFKGIKENPTFYLEPGKRVIIVFQQYEIAPYSEGILKFPMRY